jgi:hypothetical protein
MLYRPWLQITDAGLTLPMLHGGIVVLLPTTVVQMLVHPLVVEVAITV